MRKPPTTATWIHAGQSAEGVKSVNDQVAAAGDDPITITDESTGSSASILAGVGFNCFSFKAFVAGSEIDVIYAEDGFGPQSELSLHGIPLLFPFAGQLDGETFEFEGNTFHVTGTALNFGGNVAHGLVISRPWRIVHQAENEVTGEFHPSVDDPSLLAQWPADFRVQVTYRVEGTSLISDVVIENPDDKSLPFGFGTHLYFRLPIGDGDAAASVITVPASEAWSYEGGRPTGDIADVSGGEDLRPGVPFSELAFDGVLTGLHMRKDGLVHTTIDDAAAGHRAEQTFAPVFRNCVIYTPSHRGAVAVEPWTTVPNAFALSARGVDTGLIVLPPGERWATRIVIKVSALNA